jgi:hypothetical protein
VAEDEIAVFAEQTTHYLRGMAMVNSKPLYFTSAIVNCTLWFRADSTKGAADDTLRSS